MPEQETKKSEHFLNWSQRTQPTKLFDTLRLQNPNPIHMFNGKFLNAIRSFAGRNIFIIIIQKCLKQF